MGQETFDIEKKRTEEGCCGREIISGHMTNAEGAAVLGLTS